MIDRAALCHLHDKSSWIDGRLGKVHRVAAEQGREMVTEHLSYAFCKMGVLLPQEDEGRWPPIMIGRHLGIKAQHLTASAKMGCGVWQPGKVLLKQRTHGFLIETVAVRCWALIPRCRPIMIEGHR